MLDSILKAYNEAVFETDKEAAFQVIDEALAQGVSPEDIVFKIVIPALEAMMAEITKDPDANLAQHFMTAQIASEITERMLVKFQHPPDVIGRVVIGTSFGDLHSLGKRIVTGCLRALMVDVVDLGVNIPAERFVAEAIDRGAQVIAISSMMVHTATGENGCIKARQILRERGLEKRFRLVVGGAPYRFDTELFKSVGADAWAVDGISAAKVIIDQIREVQSS
jgi:methanogenic corrinoid protein MtbC1